MSEEALFSDQGLRAVSAAAPDEDTRTRGQKLRDRQQARISSGLHPLSIDGMRITLHPDTPRDAHQGDDRNYPTCGTCVHREMVGGHAKSFPKCVIGYERRPLTEAEIARNAGTIYQHATHYVYEGRRNTSSDATDCKGWWPACTDYKPKEGTGA